MTADAPNILVVMADQMAPAFLPIYGHAPTRAPNMMDLARHGVVFDSAYCASPLCSPSRASLMTGLLPSRTRVYDTAAEFSADIPTFAHCLRLRGYRTILSGKMHFCGPDQLHGFEGRLTTDIYPADYGWTPDWDHPNQRPSWYHNMSFVAQAGVCVRTNQLDFDDEVVFASERAIYDIARGADRRPPSPIRTIPSPSRSATGTSIATRISPRPRRRSIRTNWIHIRVACGMSAPSTPSRSPKAQICPARRAYLGAAYVDDNLGRLLAALSASGLAENTIVILTSDHGEMLGDRGLWYKMSFFEGACRVPLVVAVPAASLRAASERASPSSTSCRRWLILRAATSPRSAA